MITGAMVLKNIFMFLPIVISRIEALQSRE